MKSWSVNHFDSAKYLHSDFFYQYYLSQQSVESGWSWGARCPCYRLQSGSNTVFKCPSWLHLRAWSKSYGGSTLESSNLLYVCITEFLMCHWLSPTAPHWPHISKYALLVRPNTVSQGQSLQWLPADVMAVPSGGEVICGTLLQSTLKNFKNLRK